VGIGAAGRREGETVACGDVGSEVGSGLRAGFSLKFSVSGMNRVSRNVPEKSTPLASIRMVQVYPFSINAVLIAGPKKPEITSAE
jgi:uncharacterized membrane protein